MAFYTREELLVLLGEAESHAVERKRSASDRTSIRRNICAFANDLPGSGRPGVIFFGVTDDGGVAGVEADDDLLASIAQMRSSGNIQPIPSLAVERLAVAGRMIVALQVEPCLTPPVRHDGRVWVKVGPTVQEATPDDVQRLAERRRSADLPFDMRPAAGSTIEDLDLDYIQGTYLRAAIPKELLERNNRPLPQQLRALRLISGETPTWGALLACGRDPLSRLPGAYVQFLRFDGLKLTDPIKDQKQVDGRLEELLIRLEDLLRINVSVRTEFASTTREIRRPDYPLAALQQLVRNAVMHRSYEQTNAPVRVYWYSDRIEIQSPGGLYGKVTPDNFRSGVTDYRNPLIAEAMHHLGFAQRFGIGIRLATEALESNGNPPPEFHLSATHVGAVLRPGP